ncbi:hypothetical protein HK100_009457, partial [Physocladia obscura]
VATIPSPPHSRAFERLLEISFEIMKSFVQSRIDAVNLEDEEASDLLDDEATLTSILELVASVGRIKYQSSCEYMQTVFDVVANQYSELCGQSISGQFSSDFRQRLENVEAKLTWIVYIMGASVGARSPIQNSEEHEILDGELTGKILQLMNVDSNFVIRMREMGDTSNRSLDLALKIYIGPHMDVRQGREIYVRLGETFGIDDQNKMLNFIVQKLFVCF